jgi:hypothetical protein
MRFDEQGHIVWTPKELYQMVLDNPRRLVNSYLMAGTPWAFAEYVRYCDFIEAPCCGTRSQAAGQGLDRHVGQIRPGSGDRGPLLPGRGVAVGGVCSPQGHDAGGRHHAALRPAAPLDCFHLP